MAGHGVDTREVNLNEVAVKDGGKPEAHAPPAAAKPGAVGEYTCVRWRSRSRSPLVCRKASRGGRWAGLQPDWKCRFALTAAARLLQVRRASDVHRGAGGQAQHVAGRRLAHAIEGHHGSRG